MRAQIGERYLTESTNYIEQAKSFLTRNSHRLALQVVPMALMAVAVAHATPTFGNANSTSASSCSGGGFVTQGTLSSQATNSGRGISLSAVGSSFAINMSTSDCLILDWKNTQGSSGTFYGSTASLSSVFNFNGTDGTYITVNSWTIDVYLNGSQTPAYEQLCSSPTQPAALQQQLFFRMAPRSSIQTTNSCATTGTIPVPNNGNLTAWEVKLTVNATNNYGDGSKTLYVNVPSSSSIDILAPATPAAPVPVLSSAALALTALMLLGLAAFKLVGWKPADGGFPGRPF